MPIKTSSPGFSDYEIELKRKPKKSILDKINQLIDWYEIEKILSHSYKAGKSPKGEKAYPPLIMFKVLILQHLYNLSDEQAEESLRDRLSFLRFCGFHVSDEIPDYTTICRFRNRLLKLDLYQVLFDEFNKQLEEKGLIVKKGTLIDATVIKSSRRPKKTVDARILPEDRKEEDQQEGKENSSEIRYSDDKDARYLKKGNQVFYGYKSHVAVDGQGRFIIGGHMTPANVPDMKEMGKLLKNLKLREGSFVVADKGYAWAENVKLVRQQGFVNFIMKKAARNRPLTEKEKKQNKAISTLRYRIEQVFGHLKKHMGFERVRYVGLEKAQIEFQLKAMAYNLKMAALMLA
ncbi:hypothetical protein BREVNS_1416 [Brevinematales bacterium NS]|nr:IS5 family transposase [Brevinematales bacterium]QJR22166.1 hypothetical protein BREVNS_1416 [Brevinematales bacterium NS]